MSSHHPPPVNGGLGGGIMDGTINPAALNTPGTCFSIDHVDVYTAARIVDE
jgi:hypothetical protein